MTVLFATNDPDVAFKMAEFRSEGGKTAFVYYKHHFGYVVADDGPPAGYTLFATAMDGKILGKGNGVVACATSPVHRLYAIREAEADPVTIPPPPAPVILPMPDRLDTEAVYCGPACTENLRGFIRYDETRAADDRPAFIARTRGNATAPADIRKFDSKDAAAEWLSRAVDGVMPHKPRVRPPWPKAAL